jgi:hypothetical protein
MNTDAYSQGFDDRVSGERCQVSHTPSGKFKLPRDIARELEEEEDWEEWAEGYMAGWRDALWIDYCGERPRLRGERREV